MLCRAGQTWYGKVIVLDQVSVGEVIMAATDHAMIDGCALVVYRMLLYGGLGGHAVAVCHQCTSYDGGKYIARVLLYPSECITLNKDKYEC